MRFILMELLDDKRPNCKSYEGIHHIPICQLLVWSASNSKSLTTWPEISLSWVFTVYLWRWFKVCEGIKLIHSSVLLLISPSSKYCKKKFPICDLLNVDVVVDVFGYCVKKDLEGYIGSRFLFISSTWLKGKSGREKGTIYNRRSRDRHCKMILPRR